MGDSVTNPSPEVHQILSDHTETKTQAVQDNM